MLDEAALERAGIQYENDDAGLMAWAQEWINEHRKQTENPSAGARGRGAEDGAPGEAQGDEGGEGVTGEQQTDGPDRKSVVSGKRVSVREETGGRRISKKK